MFDFLLGTHEFLGNHSFPEFIVGYLFGAALIIGAPTVLTTCLRKRFNENKWENGWI